MKTRILGISAARPEKGKIRQAADVIRRGGLVVFPTETVYGIGADAFNRKATKRIYKVKGRPSDNPLMIHVSDFAMARRIGIFPKRYEGAVKRVWPGPIAFVVKAKPGLGRKEVSIRMPSHKVALALIRESGTPIAAPSANLSKKPSSTRAEHALAYFDGKVDVIIDSGASSRGIESTILDLRSFALQRPGSFPMERITSEFGRRPAVSGVSRGTKQARIATAPGMKYRHYSPDTPLFLYTGNPDAISGILSRTNAHMAFIGSKETCSRIKAMNVHTVPLGSRKNLGQVAHNLFDGLIRLDKAALDFAVIESFPESGMGLGIMNRIRKASDNRAFSTRRQLERLVKGLNTRKTHGR